MIVKRILGTLTALGIALGALAACSSSSSDANNGGGGGRGGGSSTTERSKTGECKPSDCTDQEQQDYSSCLTTQCDAEYAKCLGSDYKNGNFGGPCKAYMECTTKCKCGDTACTQACGVPPPSECVNCLTQAGQCANSKCPAPKCYSQQQGGGDAGSSSGTCADLAACCASITDATKKATCEQQFAQVQAAGDAACGAMYSQQKSAGNCQ